MSDFRQNPTWPIPPDVFKNRIVDLERQLAEKTAEAKDLRSHYKWALAEIEAMRPMVEACKARHVVHNQFPGFDFIDSGATFIQCPCLTCQWYRDYESRKQP